MRLRYLYLSLVILAMAMFTSAPRLMADGVRHCDRNSDAITDFSSFGNHDDILLADFQQGKGGDWDWKGAKWDNDGGGRNWWTGKGVNSDPVGTVGTPEPSVLTLLLASVVALLGVSLLKKTIA
jgi:hypothetical protein